MLIEFHCSVKDWRLKDVFCRKVWHKKWHRANWNLHWKLKRHWTQFRSQNIVSLSSKHWWCWHWSPNTIWYRVWAISFASNTWCTKPTRFSWKTNARWMAMQRFAVQRNQKMQPHRIRRLCCVVGLPTFASISTIVRPAEAMAQWCILQKLSHQFWIVFRNTVRPSVPYARKSHVQRTRGVEIVVSFR